MKLKRVKNQETSQKMIDTLEDEIQKITDKMIEDVESLASKKNKELMSV